MRFWTSDQHFGHARIIELANRPFTSVEEMNETIIERWNAVVSERDEVYVLGDFAMGKIAETLPIAARLNGYKALIAGNHDRCHPSFNHSKPGARADWTSRYFEAGFQCVSTLQWLFTDFPRSHARASHFPPSGDSQGGDRFDDWRPRPEPDEIMLHGHVHEKWRKRGNWVNVGVDVWDFTPVTDEQIIALFD